MVKTSSNHISSVDFDSNSSLLNTNSGSACDSSTVGQSSLVEMLGYNNQWKRTPSVDAASQILSRLSRPQRRNSFVKKHGVAKVESQMKSTIRFV